MIVRLNKTSNVHGFGEDSNNWYSLSLPRDILIQIVCDSNYLLKMVLSLDASNSISERSRAATVGHLYITSANKFVPSLPLVARAVRWFTGMSRSAKQIWKNVNHACKIIQKIRPSMWRHNIRPEARSRILKHEIYHNSAGCYTVPYRLASTLEKVSFN